MERKQYDPLRTVKVRQFVAKQDAPTRALIQACCQHWGADIDSAEEIAVALELERDFGEVLHSRRDAAVVDRVGQKATDGEKQLRQLLRRDGLQDVADEADRRVAAATRQDFVGAVIQIAGERLQGAADKITQNSDGRIDDRTALQRAGQDNPALWELYNSARNG